MYTHKLRQILLDPFHAFALPNHANHNKLAKFLANHIKSPQKITSLWYSNHLTSVAALIIVG